MHRAPYTPYTLHPTNPMHPMHPICPALYALYTVCTIYTLHPTYCTLHITPYTLHPKPYILHLIHPKTSPYTLHPTPYTLGNTRSNASGRTAAMDKTRGLLWGGVAPDNKSLRIIQNARLPSGKKVVLQEPPVSDFATLEYEAPKEFTTDLRKVRFWLYLIPVLLTACLHAQAGPCSARGGGYRSSLPLSLSCRVVVVSCRVVACLVLSCLVLFSLFLSSMKWSLSLSLYLSLSPNPS
jgi:hypothetical protein